MDTAVNHTANENTAAPRPVIDITSCPAATINKKMVIAGTINTMAKDLQMYVNGQEYKIMGGKFLISLPLDAGPNDFDILLTSRRETIAREKRSIFCGALPPILRMEPVPDVTPKNILHLSGTLTNPNQIKEETVLKLNGRPLDMTSEGTFELDFPLKEGSNDFELIALDAALRKSAIKKVIAHHPQAPEIFFEGLDQVASTHNISFTGKLLNYNDNTMNIRIHNKAMTVKDNSFAYQTSIRTESAVIPFAIEVSGRSILKFERTVFFSAPPPRIEVEDEIKKTSPLQCRISGSITDENDVDPVLRINDREVLPKKGQWSASLTLQYGENTVLIEGKNNAGKKTVIRKKLYVPVPTPIVTLGDYPEVTDKTRIILNGDVQDELEKAVTLTLDSENVKLTPSNKFNVAVNLKDGKNKINLTAVTEDGRKTEKILEVDHSLLFKLIKITDYAPRTSSALFTLRGTVEEAIASERVGELYVNGQRVPIQNSQWEASVNLRPGENYLQVRVQTESGQRVDIQKSIWYDKAYV